jgi:SulP family sulfate permease
MSAGPIDNAQYARSVREDTAELASYALSDKGSARSVSPPPRRGLAQSQLESYFAQPQENDVAPSRSGEGLQRLPIKEVSEPVSPESSSSSDKSHSSSALTDMLKRSLPSSSVPDRENEDEGEIDDHSHSRYPDEENGENGRLIITSNGVSIDTTERTPLLSKSLTTEHHHPDYISGEQDVEGEVLRRRSSWPKIRNIIFWPKLRGVQVAKMAVNPKSWDRQAIWRHAILDPVGYLPAVILGLLLNILDALSYGTFRPMKVKDLIHPRRCIIR